MAGGCYVPIEVKEFSEAVLGQIRDSSGIRYWVADERTRQNAQAFALGGCFLLPVEDITMPVGQFTGGRIPKCRWTARVRCT